MLPVPLPMPDVAPVAPEVPPDVTPDVVPGRLAPIAPPVALDPDVPAPVVAPVDPDIPVPVEAPVPGLPAPPGLCAPATPTARPNSGATTATSIFRLKLRSISYLLSGDVPHARSGDVPGWPGTTATSLPALATSGKGASDGLGAVPATGTVVGSCPDVGRGARSSRGMSDPRCA